MKYKVRIDFDENLDLKNYVEFLKESSFYELIGVVTHYGESGASGHFMARCKSPIDNYWYLYNDSIVEKIGFFTKEAPHVLAIWRPHGGRAYFPGLRASRSPRAVLLHAFSVLVVCAPMGRICFFVLTTNN